LSSSRFILASASPRRAELLRDAGYEFEVEAPELDETKFPHAMMPVQVATYLAEEKARRVSARRPDEVVLAADTVVAFGDLLLGKPDNAEHARKMLQLLSGTTHIVITGVAVARAAEKMLRSGRAMSAVRMRFLTPAEIDRYIASGQWEGKAGGYGIQDHDPFVTNQAGSTTNIVGLPMRLTKQLLAEAGITPT
jgi:septum formation protein